MLRISDRLIHTFYFLLCSGSLLLIFSFLFHFPLFSFGLNCELGLRQVVASSLLQLFSFVKLSTQIARLALYKYFAKLRGFFELLEAATYHLHNSIYNNSSFHDKR